MLQRVPNYIKYIFINVLVLFLYIVVFRVIFYSYFAQLEKAADSEIQKAFGLGLRFDSKLAVLSIFPLALLIFVVNYRFLKYKAYKLIGNIYLTLVYVIITLFHIFDFGYYDYLDIRLDAASLRFLSNLEISTQVLFESYPVYKGLFGLLILTFLIYKLVSWIYNKFSTNNYNISKKRKAFFIVVPFLLLAFGIYNSFTHYPLRWSQAFFSKNNAVNQFALNPVLYFYDSFKFRSEGVDVEATKKYFPAVAKHLGISIDSLNFTRTTVYPDSIQQKPNVVIVMLESLGVVPMSYFGNPLNSTPKMDSIMKQSALFSNFFVHKPGTAASVFASITGLPDVDGVKTASRNPMIIDQRIVFDQFDGYEKLYFLGGSANWANIRGIFQSNINGLKIFEEGSYGTENRADVWGIDDYELFKESNKELAKLYQEKKPFIAYIQTATNHIPFTVPAEKESFKPLPEDAISKEDLKAAGFDGIARLNALRYLDFNVAKYLERAKEAGYYDNTIFLFFGDHNTSMSTVKNFKKEFDLGLQIHHVPMFIHAPKYISPQVISKYTNLVDLVPTAASLAKINYTNYTLGENALDTTKTSNISFIYNKINGEPGVGLLKDNFYLTKTLVTNTKNLYNLKSDSTDDVKKQFPKIEQEMDSLLSGFYHSTKYLYFNNKKVKK